MFIPDLSPLWVSTKVVLTATLITTALGTMTAYKIYRHRMYCDRIHGKHSAVQNIVRSAIEKFLIMPLILPPTVMGFILLMLLGRNGSIGQFMAHWEFKFIFTWYAGVLAAVTIAFPLMYRSALGAFEQIDKILLDAATVEGASEWQVFWYVALPLALPGILGGIVLAFARALGEFGATLMLAGNIPGQTQTIPMAIYFAVEAGDTTEGWFWVIIIIAISLVGIFIIDRCKSK